MRPAGEGRYQIVYGRRRLRAAARLGVRVKALVRPLSDVELVIAQGKENLERKDLSYIERAQFARALEAQGFERSVIMSALATDKADLSRYLSIAKAVPDKIIRAIGPAPKTGRPRWAALAPLLKTGAAKAEAAIARKEFKTLDSDARFAAVFDALSQRRRRANAGERAPGRLDEGGANRATSRPQPSSPSTRRRLQNFGDYLVDRLDALYRQFQREKEAPERKAARTESNPAKKKAPETCRPGSPSPCLATRESHFRSSQSSRTPSRRAAFLCPNRAGESWIRIYRRRPSGGERSRLPMWRARRGSRHARQTRPRTNGTCSGTSAPPRRGSACRTARWRCSTRC